MKFVASLYRDESGPGAPGSRSARRSPAACRRARPRPRRWTTSARRFPRAWRPARPIGCRSLWQLQKSRARCDAGVASGCIHVYDAGTGTKGDRSLGHQHRSRTLSGNPSKHVEKDAALARIRRQLAELSALHSSCASTTEFKKCRRNTELAIEHAFGTETRHLQDFARINWTPSQYVMGQAKPSDADAFSRGFRNAEALLESMVQEIDEYWDDSRKQPTANPIAIIENLCNRFHLVARQLRSRHNNRSTIEVQDEYDVQDLLHGLLKLTFDDVRPEEWTPSYAGKSARVDFLLKAEEIVIEAKKTGKSLGASGIGDQLLVDIMRYKAHPDCRRLICFVYDSELRIDNPKSFENDLSTAHDGLDVMVIIAPKGL